LLEINKWVKPSLKIEKVQKLLMTRPTQSKILPEAPEGSINLFRKTAPACLFRQMILYYRFAH